jgi:hypothetical protein
MEYFLPFAINYNYLDNEIVIGQNYISNFVLNTSHLAMLIGCSSCFILSFPLRVGFHSLSNKTPITPFHPGAGGGRGFKQAINEKRNSPSENSH